MDLRGDEILLTCQMQIGKFLRIRNKCSSPRSWHQMQMLQQNQPLPQFSDIAAASISTAIQFSAQLNETVFRQYHLNLQEKCATHLRCILSVYVAKSTFFLLLCFEAVL